jgi:hypothetical protein
MADQAIRTRRDAATVADVRRQGSRVQHHPRGGGSMSENDKDEAWQRHVKRRMDSHVQYCATLARENGLVHSVCSIRR